jgi:hypothetical protein
MVLRDALVDFSRVLRRWDGFGVNYVQACQTADYERQAQDYGGFGILAEADRRKVVEMVFSEDGLKPGLVKMFLDPFHQPEPGTGYRLNDPSVDLACYDHESTTEWMRLFAREGLKLTRARGDDLQIIVTLYGPPGWMTLQRTWRGRDLNPALKVECAKYMASFGKYLREVEGMPVRYLSLHNEGEDWTRWSRQGLTVHGGHDYNLYWPCEQVVDFLRFMPGILEANGMAGVGVTPGECSNWLRFVEWGYAQAIADDDEALANMALVTSHGFWSPGFHRWAGDWRSTGVDLLREKRPELHAWVTSTSWSKMDVAFLAEIRESIYCAKVNAIIPWACIQRPALWEDGDPNPGTAFRVSEEGKVSVQPGYWWYRHACRAGQPGTGVARVASNDTQLMLIAFADNGTGKGDAVVLLNTGEEAREVTVEVRGARKGVFEGYRTCEGEWYAAVGRIQLADGHWTYHAPPASATTLLSC